MNSLRPHYSEIHRRVRQLTFAALVLGSIYVLGAVYSAADGRSLDALAALVTGGAALGLTRVLYLYWMALESYLAAPEEELALPVLVVAQARFWRYLVLYVVLVVIAGLVGAIGWLYAFVGAVLHLPNLPPL